MVPHSRQAPPLRRGKPARRSQSKELVHGVVFRIAPRVSLFPASITKFQTVSNAISVYQRCIALQYPYQRIHVLRNPTLKYYLFDLITCPPCLLDSI